MQYSRIIGLLSILMTVAFAAHAEQSTVGNYPVGMILSCTPLIDGIDDADDWTPFQTISGSSETVTTSASWDSQNLYFQIKGPEMISAIIYIDAKTDGILNGADNYHITISPAKPKPSVDAQVYNSLVGSSVDSLRPIVIDAIAAASTTKGTVIEVAIPWRDVGLDGMHPNGKVAISASATLAGAEPVVIPVDARANMRIITLTDQTATQNSSVVLDMRIKDRRVVPGQTVSLDFTGKNITSAPLAYTAYTITGYGRLADISNFLRVRGGTMAANDGVKAGFSTDLPDDIPLGAYALVADMKLDGDQSARLLSSFEVVEALDVMLDTGSGPVTPITERKIVVTLRNNRNKRVTGTVRLTLAPVLQSGLDKTLQKFRIQWEDDQARLEFKLTPKQGVPAGEYEVRAEVEAEGFNNTVTGAILVGRKQQ